ncbi:hypothetical protein [Corynebacterium glutamicum]|uniref:hypothetical protein n=1 Tax=Corynebacterium glutamicum TaxID=1718 RepID=UPI001B8BA072|nr:hypothetical protein [Corynebacterium glutamicum]
MSIRDLSDEELNARYIEANDEIARRRRLAAIPAEISELAQQGREIGVEEATMIDAVTRAPEEAPAGE